MDGQAFHVELAADDDGHGSDGAVLWLEDELPRKWLVTGMRGRAATTANAVSAAPAAVLETTRSDEEAAMILVWMSSGVAAKLEPAQMELMHAAMATAAPEMEKLAEPVRDDALVVVGAAAKKPKMRPLDDLMRTPPNPTPAAEAKLVEPRLTGILSSPASDGKYVCGKCGLSFPTHYALGGHATGHKKVSKSSSGEQILEGDIAAVHALGSSLAQNHQSQGDAVVPDAVRELSGIKNMPPPPPAATDPVRRLHPCSKCCLVFSSGQALGGHMRVHLNEEKERIEIAAKVAAASAAAAAAPGYAPPGF